AADRGRRGEGPTLIETVSYRLTAHSSDDDDRVYRDKEEVEEAKKNDSIVTFAAYLKEVGVLTEESEKQMLDEIMH
ncbi:thiamine pyrophosphate-dependent enzyme, partial [Acinetobacter baumannii]